MYTIPIYMVELYVRNIESIFCIYIRCHGYKLHLFLCIIDSDTPEDPIIVTYIMPLPPNNQKLTIDITNILGGLLFPFAASFLFPVKIFSFARIFYDYYFFLKIFIAALVKDKRERHLIMMEQNGLQRTTYWVITYMFNYLLYILIAIVISIVSIIWQIRLFTQVSGLFLINNMWHTWCTCTY